MYYCFRAVTCVSLAALSAMIASCASDVAQAPGPSHVLMPKEEASQAIVCGLGGTGDRDAGQEKRCTTPPEREDTRKAATEATNPDR